MFNSIRGELTEKCFDSVRVSTMGIEWDISVPAISIASLGATGETVRVYTWLHHREDAMKLYGFASESERSLFLDLLKVEGIGPKQAMKFMSGIPQGDFRSAIEGEDLARLERIPGLGKKTAQKLVFSLKGKIVPIDVHESAVADAWADVVKALSDMGYDRKTAAETVRKIAAGFASHTPETEKEVFRQAIVRLSV